MLTNFAFALQQKASGPSFSVQFSRGLWKITVCIILQRSLQASHPEEGMPISALLCQAELFPAPEQIHILKS